MTGVFAMTTMAGASLGCGISCFNCQELSPMTSTSTEDKASPDPEVILPPTTMTA